MNRGFIRIAMLAAGMATCAITAASAQNKRYSIDDIKAYQVMGGLAKYARQTAHEADDAGRGAEAAVWESWASRYAFNQSSVSESLSARQMLTSSISGNERMASLFASAGKPAHAKLYLASAVMMQDLLSQLQRGPVISPKFPREMLIALDNAPGTPWEHAYVYATLPTSSPSASKPAAGEKVCPTCSGARQWRCNNCLGSGSAGYLKHWTGSPLSDTGYGGRTGFISQSCYNCNGTGWIRCQTCWGRGVVAAKK